MLKEANGETKKKSLNIKNKTRTLFTDVMFKTVNSSSSHYSYVQVGFWLILQLSSFFIINLYISVTCEDQTTSATRGLHFISVQCSCPPVHVRVVFLVLGGGMLTDNVSH